MVTQRWQASKNI